MDGEVPLPSKTQRRLETEENKNQLLKLRLAEPFPAHDSDELEEPLSDSRQSPLVFNSQPDKEAQTLFSPKFGGGQPLESQNSQRANYDMPHNEEEVKDNQQKAPAFTSVIGNLL